MRHPRTPRRLAAHPSARRRSTLGRALAALTLVAAATSATAGRADAQSVLLDFEDLAYAASAGGATLWPGGAITASYGGLEWTNFRPLDLANYPLHRPDADPAATGNAGYPDAAPYGDVLGLSFGDVLLRPTNPLRRFQLESGAFGAGWTDGMTLDVTGRRGGATMFEQTYTLHATSTSSLAFPDFELDELLLRPTFLAAGYGDPYRSAAQNLGIPFQTFWFDNLNVVFAGPGPTVAPEPATLALLGGGLALLGVAVRRRRHGRPRH